MMPRTRKPNIKPSFNADPKATLGKSLYFATPTKPTAAEIWVLFAIALAVRILHVVHANRFDPYWGWFVAGFDQNVFQTWAKAFASGDWLIREAGIFYYSPLFAYFCGALYRIFGLQNFWAVHLAQAFVGAFGCSLFFVIARTWLPRPMGWIAALLFILAAPVLYYEQALLIEGLVLTAWVVWLWGLRTADLGPEAGYRFPQLRRVAAGLAIAIAMVGRGNALAMIVATIPWLMLSRCNEQQPTQGEQAEAFQRTMRRFAISWRAPACFIAGICIVLIPLLVRNHVVSGKWTLGMSNGRVLFYLGNAADADGTFTYSTRFQEAHAKGGADPGIYLRMFREDLQSNPSAILKNLARKVYFFLGANDLPDNLNYQLAQRVLAPVGWNPVQWAWLAPVGLIGLALTILPSLRASGRNWTLFWLFGVIFPASIIIILPIGRYRLPYIIGLALGTGITLEWLAVNWKARRFCNLCSSGLAILILGGILWPWQGPLIRQNDYVNTIQAALKTGHLNLADKTISMASNHYPDLTSLWLGHRLKLALLSGNRDAIAMAAARLSTQRGMTPEGAINLVMAYRKLGETEKAISVLRFLRKAMPKEPQVESLARELGLP